MDELASVGLDAVTVPASLFAGNGYLKIKFAFGRSNPLTGSNVVTVTNTTTGQVICSFSVLDGDNFSSTETTVNLYQTSNQYNVGSLVLLNDSGALNISGSTDTLASNVFNTGLDNVLSFTATDDSAGNYVVSAEVIGYIKP